ncbi:Hypothetical protein R9X50_00766100 [Acrodontium crateriforme]|uniref:Uncharacterized protein n=1 Tax=Acrodontium crateriforme TaxID=150365 RepID=A0AAQ3MD29_9PEZI|nr:Hypothetical protein R9X50_00766100 [Acrodontium crateriforme]
MVLEGSTSDSAFVEDGPASDIDPYASIAAAADPSMLQVTPSPNPVFVNLNQLPRRWSLLIEKQHAPALLQGIRDQCEQASKLLQRPVRQDEADAMAFHFAKSMRIASYGSPIGAIIGTGFAVRGQSTYRFPLWSPFKEGSRFSPDVFGPLKGAAARSMWNMSRLGAYWIVGSVLCQTFMGSYALSTSLAGRMMDPRMKDIMDAIKAQAQDRRGSRLPDETPARRGPETFDMARQRRGAQEIARGGHSSPSNVDDASPTGGMFEYEVRGSTGDAIMQTDEQVRNADEARERIISQRAAQQASQHEHTAQQATQENDRRRSPSSWDRLRKNAMSGESSSPPRNSDERGSRRGPDESDPFAFSNEQGERTLANQKFRQGLDWEREGKDFADEAEPRRGGWRR